MRLSVRVVERQFWLREDPVAQGIVLWTFNPVPAGFFVCCAKEVPGELTSASVPWCCLWFLQANEQNSHMRLFALAIASISKRCRLSLLFDHLKATPTIHPQSARRHAHPTFQATGCLEVGHSARATLLVGSA